MAKEFTPQRVIISNKGLSFMPSTLRKSACFWQVEPIYHDKIFVSSHADPTGHLASLIPASEVTNMPGNFFNEFPSHSLSMRIRRAAERAGYPLTKLQAAMVAIKHEASKLSQVNWQEIKDKYAYTVYVQMTLIDDKSGDVRGIDLFSARPTKFDSIDIVKQILGKYMNAVGANRAHIHMQIKHHDELIIEQAWDARVKSNREGSEIIHEFA